MKIVTVILVALLLFGAPALAEQRWVWITLERTPIVDGQGKVLQGPVYHARKPERVTRGGEWVVPKILAGTKTIERYQREGLLLMLVDVPPETVLPGDVKSTEEAAALKNSVFGIALESVDSGVTK